MSEQRKKAKRKVKKSQVKDRDGISHVIISSLKGSALGLIISLILAFPLCAVAYMSSDPDALLFPLSMLAIYLPSFIAGIIAIRLAGSQALMCGLFSGGGFMLVYMFISFFFSPKLSANYSFPISLLLHALIIVFTLVGAYIGQHRRKKRKARR